MFGFGQHGQAKPPFGGQSAPTPFGSNTGTPSFGTSTQSPPTFGSSFITPTPSFGSTSSVFGSPSQSVFRTSTPMAPASNSFGGTVFGAGRAQTTSMDDDEMNQTQTSTFPLSSDYGSTAGSTFGAVPSMFGKTEEPKPFLTSSVFGQRSDTPMASDSPVFEGTASGTSLFGRTTVFGAATNDAKNSPDPLTNVPLFPSTLNKATPILFGKPVTTEQSTSLLGNSTTGSSSVGKSSFVKHQTTSGQSEPKSRTPDSAFRNSTATDNKPPQQRSLFGKALEAIPKVSNEKAVVKDESSESLTSSQKVLFGKVQSDSTFSKVDQSESTGLFGANTKQRGTALFGKSTQSGSSSLFEKSIKSETSTLFSESNYSSGTSTLLGKSTDTSSLFGKSLGSSGLFGKTGQPPEPGSLFGKLRTQPQVSFTRTIENEPNESTSTDIKLETSETVGIDSVDVFSRLKGETSGGLFGEPSQGTSFNDSEEPYQPLRRPSKTLFGKPTSLTTEAARRSVKKSLSLQRSISSGDEAKTAKDSSAGSRYERPLAYRSDDINRRVAIVVENAPAKVNNKDVIKRFFSKFGTVIKVFNNLKAMKAIVHFDRHESAAKAMRGGRSLADGVRIVWSSHVQKRPAPVKNEPSTSYDADTSRSVDPERSALTDLDSKICQTTKDKADFLAELETRMRSDRKKETRLDKAVALIGTCQDMCPERERYVREEQRRLHPFEMFKAEDNVRGNNYVDHSKAVKEYSRSSADQDEPLPHELRPPPILARTMDYLVANIMDKGNDTNWTEWYDFLWNRTRSIRKDITQQHLCDLTAVDLLEKCTRFHIYSGMRLCELSMMDFDQKINSENLTKCLQTLKELYHDLKVRQNVDCPNEADFRGYMVLMKLNEGDILREVQTYPDQLRRSDPVRFAVEVHQTVSNNNYIRFFKLVRHATFHNACLMFRYFTQVRVSALLTIMKAFKTKGGLQYPTADLYQQLGFENYDDVIQFCEDHGLEEAHSAIVMERNTFVEPESGSSVIRRPKRVIESKHQGLIGEIVQGGPSPNGIPLEPTFSFDSEGRYLGEYGRPILLSQPPAATSSPSPSSDATSVKAFTASPIKVPALVEKEPIRFKYTNEEVKVVAKEMFLEVIDEIVREMCSTLLLTAHLADQTTRQLVDSMVHEQVINIARALCEEAVGDESRNREKMEEERLRQEQAERLCEELVQQIGDDVTSDVISEESLSTAMKTLSHAREEKRQKQMHQIAEDIRDDLLQQTTDDLVAVLADEINANCIRKQMLNEIYQTVLKSRLRKYWRKWCEYHRRCVRHKTTLENFPVCSNMEDESKIIARLLPNAREAGITCGAFYITQNARLTTEPAPALQAKQRQLNQRLSAATRLADLKRELAWKPLDLVSIVSSAVEKEAEMLPNKGLVKKSFEMDVYWKLLVILPDLDEDADSKLSEWICQKLKRGWVPDSDREETELLSLYRCTAPLPDGSSVRVHVCIRTVQQSLLIDAETDLLSGTSAVLVVAPPDSSERDVFEMANDVMCDLNDTQGIPVAILTCQETDFLDAQKQALMTLIILGDDVEDTKASIQLCRGLSWLIEHRPAEPTLKKSPVRKFVDDFLARDFFGPIYSDLNDRRRKGQLHQSPGVLLNLYQAAVEHLAAVAGNQTYVRHLWPAPEFVNEGSGLPEYGWNSPDHLHYVSQLLLTLSLPEFQSENLDSETWTSACQDLWKYVRNIVEEGDDSASLFSRIEQSLAIARRDFEETCYLSEQLAHCEPLYVNVPWTEIVSAMVDYQLTRLDWRDPIYAETEYPVELEVIYEQALLNGFATPIEWTEALKMPDHRLLHATSHVKDTVARAAKRKLETTVDDYETPSLKRSYIVDPTTDQAPQTYRTRSEVLDLKSRLVSEVQANNRLLQYMEQSISAHDSFLMTGDRSFLSPSSTTVQTQFISPYSKSSSYFHASSRSKVDDPGMGSESEYESKIDTSCLPADLRRRVDGILGEKRLDESMVQLAQKLRDEERANSILDMKVNLMLNEPPPVLLKRTELNVLNHISPKAAKLPSMLKTP